MDDGARRRNLEAAAALYDEAAREFDRAAGHCRVAAEHLRNGEIPRGAAHAWAAYGHAREAAERLDEQARTHATKSRLPTD